MRDLTELEDRHTDVERRTAVILGLPIVVLIAIAAGVLAVRPPAREPHLVAFASAATADAGTARWTMVSETTIFAAEAAALTGQPLRVEVQGQIDFARGLTSMVMDPRAMYESMLQHLGADLPQLAPMSMEMVTDGTWTYVRNLGDPPQRWTRTQAAQALGAGNLAQQLFGFPTDPTNTLQLLTSAADHVEQIGADTVRGEVTTHYRAILGLAQAFGATDPQIEAQLGEVLGGMGLTEIPVDVWLDDLGRMRRQTIVIQSNAAAGVPQARPSPDSAAMMSAEPVAFRSTVTLEMFDFGVPVDIRIPAPDEVDDAPLTGDHGAAHQSGVATMLPSGAAEPDLSRMTLYPTVMQSAPTNVFPTLMPSVMATGTLEGA